MTVIMSRSFIAGEMQVSSVYKYQYKIDPAGNERYLGEIDHRMAGLPLNSTEFNSVLDLLELLHKLRVIRMEPGDGETYLDAGASIYKKDR